MRHTHIFDERVTFTVTFRLLSGGEKVLTGELSKDFEGLVLFRSLRAKDDTFRAGEGCLLFGRIIVDIPEHSLSSVRVVLRDGADNEIFSGEGSIS